MKKLFLILCISFISSKLFAGAPSVWRSSWTATSDTTQNLCVNKRGFLHSVVVTSGTPNSSVSIFASSGTANSTMTVVDTSSKEIYTFDSVAIATNTAHTGLTYTTVGAPIINIQYDCY